MSKNPSRRELVLGLAAVAALILAFPAAAHPNHGRPVDREEAKIIAFAYIDQMIEQKLIDPSWLRAVAEEPVLEERDGHTEWRIVIRNDEIRKKEEQTIYMFLDVSGGFIAVNYTGR